MLKSFKDINGDKVIVGDLVSITDSEEFTSIFKVYTIQRSRRKIEVCVHNDVHGFVYVPSKYLVIEM